MTDVYGTHENVVVDLSRDDLTKIKGIGTTTAEKLYNAKIVTVRQIAEMTPEKLSETPGIGLATATKFIIAAKNYVASSQKEDIANKTPQVQEAIKVESESTPIEQFEVEEVLIEESGEINEELQTESKEEYESSQSQEKWFSEKFNYSRLTDSHPPTSKIEKNRHKAIVAEDIEIESEGVKLGAEPMLVVGSKTEELGMDDDLDFETQPKIERVNEYKEEEEELEEEQSSEIETAQEIPTIRDQAEVNKPIENIYYIRGTFDDHVYLEISNAFKEAGCYQIPRSIATLREFTKNLDYLGCKLVEVSDSLKFLFLYPVKLFNGSGTVLVDETKINLKVYQNNEDSDVFNGVKQITHTLLQIRDKMQETVLHGTSILRFFQKYLQLNLRSDKSFGNNNFAFLSGTTQYRVVIEPILVCAASPKSMEKSLVFPYQKTSNLHAIVRSDLSPLIKFIEKKYRMIERRTKKTSSIKDYRKSESELSSRVRYASIPIFGYSITLLIIYFAKMYFLLRLFNTTGFAVLGIYLSLLAFLYFRAYKTKKEFAVQLKTPYYRQTLEFNETDLLDFKEELTDELMAQFGYECLGKEASYGVIEQVETKSLKNSIETKKSEPEFKNLFEPEQVKAKITTPHLTKFGGKYSSFLEDP